MNDRKSIVYFYNKVQDSLGNVVEKKSVIRYIKTLLRYFVIRLNLEFHKLTIILLPDRIWICHEKLSILMNVL